MAFVISKMVLVRGYDSQLSTDLQEKRGLRVVSEKVDCQRRALSGSLEEQGSRWKKLLHLRDLQTWPGRGSVELSSDELS